MQYCNNCGAENTDTAQFCGQCGQSLAASQSPPAPQPGGPAAGHHQTLSLKTLLQNRYLIRKLLGKGGMGAVYLAEDQQVFDRLCVVKEMLPYYQTPQEKQQAEYNFEREARLLSTLQNPGIPQIYDYFIENNRYYLVMQFIDGENLEERMAGQGGSLPEEDVREYALQLSNTLVYISKQNPPVIHRDIKPANIILDDEGRTKLVDFGIAKATTGSGQSARMSMPLGTPGYAPPEQYSGSVEPRTDVYALGATLHHLLTGRDPRDESAFHFPPARTVDPSVSQEMAEIVDQMVQTDLALRPSPVELRTKLESVVRPQPTGPQQPQPFTFRSGAVVADISQLAATCDQHWDEAAEHLYASDFEPWLEQWNRKDLATRAASIRRRGGDRSAGLEEFIRAADHTMPMPALGLSQSKLDLGTVERGERRTFRIDVTNASRGYLRGEAEPTVSWARVWPRTFGLMAGQQDTLTVTVDTSEQDEGALRQAVVEVDSNGGQEHIICEADVTWEPALSLEPSEQIAFDTVLEGEEQSQPVTATFVVRNAGGGTLEGYIASDVPWIQLDTDSFRLTSGESVTVTAEASPTWSGEETAQVGQIQISTSSATLDLPAHVAVQKAWYTAWPRISNWLVYAALVLLGYLGAALPISVGLAAWLGWPAPSDAGIAALLILLALSPAGFHLSQRWVPRLDEMEDFHFRGSLADELVASRFSGAKVAWLAGAGLIIGALLGWAFAQQPPGHDVTLSLLAGGLMGAVAGALLAAEGEPSPELPSEPPWLATLWQGPTAATFRQTLDNVQEKAQDVASRGADDADSQGAKETVDLSQGNGNQTGTEETLKLSPSPPADPDASATPAPTGSATPITLAGSPTYAVVRSIIVMLAGSTLGLMAGSLVYGGAQPWPAVIGALLGLLLSSESHRLLAARVRWLLDQARWTGWILLGTYTALTALTLLRWQQLWSVVAAYGHLELSFPSVSELTWLALLMVAAPLGALGGLWAADGAGQSYDRARSLFMGMVNTLALVGLPVYVILAVLLNVLGVGWIRDWITILAALAAAAGAAWAIQTRRGEVEAALTQVRDAVSRGWRSAKGVLPAAFQKAWNALGITVDLSPVTQRLPAVNLRQRLRVPARITQLRSRWTRPSLAELSAEMTVPLAIGAVATAVIVEEMLAKIVVGLAVGLGTVVLYTLVLILIIVVSVVGIRYLRNQ